MPAPGGATAPLAVENYEWSPDQGRLLIYTNSKQVWRLNTRGEYWVLARASGEARPGLAALASTSHPAQKHGGRLLRGPRARGFSL